MKAEILTKTTAELEKLVKEELNNEDKDLGEIENEITASSDGEGVYDCDDESHGDNEA